MVKYKALNHCFFYIYLFISLIASNAVSQDIHLTQYYTSNVFLNPALTGNFTGDVRIAANSRSQWSQIVNPLLTNMISLEKKVLRFPDEIGVGVIVINDLLTTYNLNTNKFFLSGSYTKKIKGHAIKLGIQGGLVYKSIDMNSQTFGEQWNYNEGVFDKNISNKESGLQNSKVFPDLNLGLGWTKTIHKVRLLAGYALSHINQPRSGFVADGDKIPFRHTSNIAVTYNLKPTLSFTPHLLYMTTAKATDFLTGINGKKLLKPEMGILAGAGYRGSNVNNDALIAVIGGMYKRFEAAISTDFNVSGLSKDTRRKLAWEISLVYITPSRIADKITIPCDRY